MTLTVEINQRQFAEPIINVGNTAVMTTPPITEGYWLVRVPLGGNAIVGFPKFGTVGVGFQKEEDWNTNLPYSVDPAEIWDHIKHNKADKRITRARGIAAITLLRDTLRQMFGEKPHTCDNCGREQWLREEDAARRGCHGCGKVKRWIPGTAPAGLPTSSEDKNDG